MFRKKIDKGNIWKNSLNGIKYAIENEYNLIYIMCFIVIVLSLVIFFAVSISELLAIIITSGITMAIELINTSIEAATDLITNKENELARISKDSASASLFIMTFITIITILVIFIPKIIKLL